MPMFHKISRWFRRWKEWVLGQSSSQNWLVRGRSPSPYKVAHATFPTNVGQFNTSPHTKRNKANNIGAPIIEAGLALVPWKEWVFCQILRLVREGHLLQLYSKLTVGTWIKFSYICVYFLFRVITNMNPHFTETKLTYFFQIRLNWWSQTNKPNSKTQNWIPHTI